MRTFGWPVVGWIAITGIACDGNTETGPETTTVRYEERITSLLVDTSEGSIDLVGRDQLTVEATFTPGREGDTFQGQVSNGRLSLGSVCVDGAIGCGTSIEVNAPSDIDFELISETGAVTMDNLSFNGTVDTLTGPVTGTRLGQMELEVISTSDANHDLEFAQIPVRVVMRTGGAGNLTIRLPPGTYQFDIQTGGSTLFESGSVTDGPTGPVIEMETSLGQVTIAER